MVRICVFPSRPRAAAHADAWWTSSTHAERREEIARMLAGETVTEAARAAADDLLGRRPDAAPAVIPRSAPSFPRPCRHPRESGDPGQSNGSRSAGPRFRGGEGYGATHEPRAAQDRNGGAGHSHSRGRLPSRKPPPNSRHWRARSRITIVCTTSRTHRRSPTRSTMRCAGATPRSRHASRN